MGYKRIGPTYINAPAAPTVSNDIDDGWLVGSRWFYGNKEYFCSDNTASAAVWLNTTPSNEVVVNSISDLPTPTDESDGLGTCYRLEPKAYIIGAPLTLAYPILPTITENTFTSIRSHVLMPITFTNSSGSCFVGNATSTMSGIHLENLIISFESSNTLFNIDGGNVVEMNLCSIAGDGGLGTIKNLDVLAIIRNSNIAGFTSKLTLDTNIANEIYSLGLSTTNTLSDAYIEIKGVTSSSFLSVINVMPKSGDSFINIDSGLTGSVYIQSAILDDGEGGGFFKSGSLDQTSLSVSVNLSRGVPDSQIIGSLYMERNPTETIITNAGSFGSITAFADGGTDSSAAITAFADAGSGQVTVTSNSHGLSEYDDVEITGTTNYNGTFTIANVTTNAYTITSAWVSDDATGTWTKYLTTASSTAHGKNNGDEVWIINDNYSGLVIISGAVTDAFDIPVKYSATDTGTWEDHWVKTAGTTYVLENERASMTANNEITFQNTELQPAKVFCSYNIKGSLAAAKTFELCVVRIRNNKEERLKGTVRERQTNDKLAEGISLCTTQVQSGDIFIMKGRCLTDSTNYVVANMSVVVNV